jgi:hypothetical protein
MTGAKPLKYSNQPMNYTLWIDNEAAGPCDVCQITELFLNGTITGSTQIRLNSGEQAEQWKTLEVVFPSITALQTRNEMMQILSSEIRSTKVSITPHPQRVTVTDLEMNFGSMVVFIIKWAFASIPALIIISVVFFAILMLLAALGVGAGVLFR